MGRTHLHASLYPPLVNQAMPDALLVHDDDGQFVEVNVKACESLGYSREALLDMGVADIVADFDLAGAQALWRQMVEGRTEVVCGRHRRRDGSTFPVEVHLSLFQTQERRLYICVTRDMTQHCQLEDSLRLQAMVFENAEEGVAITDAAGTVMAVNPAFERITEYTQAELVGGNLRVLNSGRHGPAFYAEMWETIRSEGYWNGEIWNRRKGGDIYLQWESISAVRNAAGETTNYVGIAIDLNRMRHAQSDLERMAHHDPLTDLPNRLLLLSRLRHALEHARRFNSMGAVLFMDLDFFKHVNDAFGHASGDELLQMVAARIKARLREIDTLARIGGDEFVAVLVDLRTRDTADRLAGDLVAQLAQPFTLSGGHVVNIGVSVGIALFPQDADEPEDLLKRADQALYRAKREGRGRHCFYARTQ